MTLDQLPPGSEARVTHLSPERDSVMLRLMEMGVVRGARVRLRKRAPFSGPIELQLEGYVLTMRRTEAARIGVELIDPKGAHDAA